MNDNNVMIVTIARSASENGTYQPGTAGVDPTQNLNQTDPLGLSDDERDAMTKLREADTRDYREKVNRYKATY